MSKFIELDNRALISIESIDAKDQWFQNAHLENIDALAESISMVGQINPLIVQRKQHHLYRIVTGFRRFAALKMLNIKTVIVTIVNAETNALELFTLALQDNLSVRRFNPIEVSAVIEKLEQNFGLEKEEIIKSFFPLMGYGRNPKIYDLYAPLIQLDAEWQQAIVNDVVPIDFGSLMATQSEENRAAFLSLIKTLRLGKNRQREFWALLNDITKMEQLSISDVSHKSELVEIVQDQNLTPSQKSQRYNFELVKMRYPRYSRIKNQFENLIKEAQCPPGLHIQPPINFEGESFQVSFSFKSPGDFERKTRILQGILSKGIVKEIINLT